MHRLQEVEPLIEGQLRQCRPCLCRRWRASILLLLSQVLREPKHLGRLPGSAAAVAATLSQRRNDAGGTIFQVSPVIEIQNGQVLRTTARARRTHKRELGGGTLPRARQNAFALAPAARGMPAGRGRAGRITDVRFSLLLVFVELKLGARKSSTRVLAPGPARLGHREWIPR